MKFLVLLNSAAGSGNSGAEELVNRVRQRFEEHSMAAEVRLVEGSSIAGAAQEFVNLSSSGEGARRLVVGGGDGTLSAAASILAGTDIALGVLALGTLNHFAKDMRIPLDLDGAISVIAAGHLQTVDVGEVNGHVFINNSSIGIYPFFVAERTAEQRRRGVSKLAAVGPALMSAFSSDLWQAVRISSEGEVRELQTPCVFVGNNFYDPVALGRRSDLISGELCVYVVKERTRLGLASLPIRVALGMIDRSRDVEIFRPKRLEIATRGPKIRIAIDGEITEVSTPLHYRIRPHALRVIAPPSAAPSS